MLIKITKRGIRECQWSDTAQSWCAVEEERFRFSWLRENCEIEEGVSLADIFNIVENQQHLMLFLQQYSWCEHIKQYHEEAKKEPVNRAEDSSTLRIFWCADIFEGKVGIGSEFDGLNKEGELISWSFSPLSDYAHLQVKLDEKIEFIEMDKRGFPIAFSCKRNFSLLDILDAIYWEISFYGSPKETQEKMEDLKQLLEDL